MSDALASTAWCKHGRRVLADTNTILIALGGVATGAALAWFLARQRTHAAVAAREAGLRGEHVAREAVLTAAGADEKLGLSTKLATAEAHASRLPELQRELDERDRALAALRDEKTAEVTLLAPKFRRAAGRRVFPVR